MLDDRGVLMVDSATLSSALWAVAQIRDSGAAPSPQWAGGFSRAAQEFKKEADIVEGLRREAALAETAPPQDEDSLWTLLHIAHEASGIAGTPRLDSQRIIISSVVVSDCRAGDTHGRNRPHAEDQDEIHDDIHYISQNICLHDDCRLAEAKLDCLEKEGE